MAAPAVLLAVALATLLAPASGAPVHHQASRNKLLLVSFDGFRWNYDQDVDTPNLDAMALDGVKARYMTPAFITLTSPCHFTLVTGECWPPMGFGVVGGAAENPRNPQRELQCGHGASTRGAQSARTKVRPRRRHPDWADMTRPKGVSGTLTVGGKR